MDGHGFPDGTAVQEEHCTKGLVIFVYIVHSRVLSFQIAAAIQKQRRDDETDQERAHARLIRVD